MEWISIEDKLPDEYVPVLTFGINGYVVAYYMGSGWNDIKWSCYTDPEYWMPLPEEPQEQE